MGIADYSRGFMWAHAFPAGQCTLRTRCGLRFQEIVLCTDTREHLRLVRGLTSRRKCRGSPWDAPREFPWDPAGNFEGIIARPHDIPLSPVVLPWDPGSYGGYPRYTVGSRGMSHGFSSESHGFPWGSRGFPRNSMGISRVLTGNHTAMTITCFPNLVCSEKCRHYLG